MAQNDLTFYEFFAGGGMARAGLGEAWTCTFANDFSATKAAAYRKNWGDGDFILGDIAKVSTEQLPGRASLAWASFPCQDLSLAGAYAGLGAHGADVITRSGTFWHFWSLIKGMKREGRAPRTIVLENVYGALTSRGGADFAAIGTALADGGYWFGAVVIDAALFVPQSRPRVFFVATLTDRTLPRHLTTPIATEWHPGALTRAQAHLRGLAQERWVWWNLPPVPTRTTQLGDLVEEAPADVAWHSDAETARLLSMMSEGNRKKVETASQAAQRVVGTIYRRTRPDEDGVKHQRAEVRFDGVAGCLRTPGGGSSRQTIMVVEGKKVRSRLLSAREAARLMGLPDTYILPGRYNEAYHLAGDGVCVDVVRFLAKSLLEPLNAGSAEHVAMAAE
jgi:DNA (cytosine-5)-methyltransferase 1